MSKNTYPERKLQRIQRTKKEGEYKQYFIVLPPNIVNALGWKKGDSIQIILDAGDIRLRKKKE